MTTSCCRICFRCSAMSDVKPRGRCSVKCSREPRRPTGRRSPDLAAEDSTEARRFAVYPSLSESPWHCPGLCQLPLQLRRMPRPEGEASMDTPWCVRGLSSCPPLSGVVVTVVPAGALGSTKSMFLTSSVVGCAPNLGKSSCQPCFGSLAIDPLSVFCAWSLGTTASGSSNSGTVESSLAIAESGLPKARASSSLVHAPGAGDGEVEQWTVFASSALPRLQSSFAASASSLRWMTSKCSLRSSLTGEWTCSIASDSDLRRGYPFPSAVS
mmetsp:Transcript_29449/g.91800  ORF Transcript_29449/g.91800 Transcript_29449/m.91800 type:complete len:269 (-) Transcript_29449:19-825(-)